jgi:sugar O-acyltransferase (sialic acid O-acetyltransferase NeuD family)
MSERIVIVGAGDQAESIADLIDALRRRGDDIELLGYLDDDPTVSRNSSALAKRIGALELINSIKCDGIIICIEDNCKRKKLFDRAKALGHKVVTLIHPSAIVAPSVTIGEGSIIFADVVINEFTEIGVNVLINTNVLIEHHCHIDAHICLASGVHLFDTVTINIGASLGENVEVHPNKIIGRLSIVGAGAVVTDNLPDCITAVGIPARTTMNNSTSESHKSPIKVLILGAGGHSKVVADTILFSTEKNPEYSIVGILDDNLDLRNASLMGIPVLGPITRFNEYEHDAIIIAIGDNEIRAKVYQYLSDFGEKFITIAHPMSYVAKSVTIGPGTVLIGNSVVNADAKVGKNVIINTNATVGHDSIIEDHVHIAAGVHLGGASIIQEGAFLGMGTNVLPGRIVGAWSVVGSGSVITKDVPPGVVVCGSPARLMKQKTSSLQDVDVKWPPIRGFSGMVSNQTSGTNLLIENDDRKEELKTVDGTGEQFKPTKFYMLDLSSEMEWNGVLKRCSQYDFYFLPCYNELEQKRTGGKAELCVYEEREFLIAMPLLFRKVDNSRFCNKAKEDWNDCSSVYGYAGPIASSLQIPVDVIHNFQHELSKAMHARSVISVFTRLHPLMFQNFLLNELGVIIQGGRTVSVDLTISTEKQLSLYRINHIRDIKKLLKMGVKDIEDESWNNLDAFMQMYQETMHRVNATSEYSFDTHYFKGLRDIKQGKSHLLFCSLNGELIAGGIFIECNGILEYHLGGTPDKYVRLAPMKLLLNAARLLGNKLGLRIFHLGGGVGSDEDSLFHFKSGFSNKTHGFLTWRWIVDPYRYRLLCENTIALEKSVSVVDPKVGYFPAYRIPVAQEKNG